MKVAIRDEATGKTESIKGVINTGIQVQHIGWLLIVFIMLYTYKGKVKQGLRVIYKQPADRTLVQTCLHKVTAF